jgi:pimeloyl-ACP methyl ester carboxylesterase
MRIACKHPDRITAIISQNGNVYEEGLGEKWKARAAYWAHPTEELRESFKSAFRAPAVTAQYMGGEAEDEIQSDLIYDYRTNVAFYPTFQKYLRTYQPPLLAIWGKNDVSFIPAGAKAFQKDLPNAVIRLLDAGHFALETHSREIGNKILQFLAKENI